jgi:hypothetical protein
MIQHAGQRRRQMVWRLFLATVVMLVGAIAQEPRSKRTLEPRPGVTITPTAFTAKRYYPGRDGTALAASSRPLVQHNNSGHGSQHGVQYRELGQALVAACHKNVQIGEVTRLLEAGADPSFLDDAGGRSGSKGHNTPLLQAIRADDADKVGLLLAAGAHATRPQRNGNLPLVAAARRGKPAVVSALVQHGVNVDDQHDVSGQTALHVAAKLGHVEVVTLLCEAGANVDVGEEGDGATPLHLAARYNHAPVRKAEFALMAQTFPDPVLLPSLDASATPRVCDFVGGLEAAGVWGARKYGVDLA